MEASRAVQYGAVAAAEALATVAITTMYSHRELTHRSLTLDPGLRAMSRAILNTTGVVPEVWAAVHLVHHRWRDVNGVPFVEVGDLLEHDAKHGKIAGSKTPDVFSGLDSVAEFGAEEVLAIAKSIRGEIGNRYKRPESYGKEDRQRLYDPTKPQFYYDTRPGRLKQRLGKPGATLAAQPRADIYRLRPEIRDPHSPNLHRQGTRGILLYNVPLYREVAAYFTDPANRPEHLRGNGTNEGELPSRLWMAGLFAANIALAGMLQGGIKPADLLRHGLAGSAITLSSYVVDILGGNFTNSFGHGGEHPIRALFTNKLTPKPDGTFATKAPLLSPATFDEVGGQDVHHERPDLVAYSFEKGLKKLLEAPFGTMLEQLAKDGLGMRPGPGFDVPFNQRPDMASEATLMIEAARVRTMARAAA